MSKGYSANIKEQDIAYGFKMKRRIEKFDLSLSSIDAHTFRIIEIIEEEEQQVKTKEQQKIRQKLNEAN